MSLHTNHYDELDKAVQESLKDFETPTNDWSEFQARYRHHKMMKRLKTSSIGIAIATILALALYLGLRPASTSQTDETTPLTHLKNTVSNNTEQTPSTTTTAPNTAVVPSKNTNTQETPIEETPQKQSITNTTDTSHQNQTSQPQETPKIPITESTPAVVPTPSITPTITTSKSTTCVNTDVSISTNITNSNYTYRWTIDNNSFTAPPRITTQFDSKGQHRIFLEILANNQIIGKTNLTITVLPLPKINFVVTTSDDMYHIDIKSQQANSYTWILDHADSYTSSTAELPMKEGNHIITAFVRNEGCIDTITYSFKVRAPIKVFTPTAFVPDNNGINDSFGPTFSKTPQQYKLLIFDSFGKLIFSTTQPEKQWDGKINGVVTPGVYQWNMVYEDESGKLIKKTGQVRLQLH